MIIISKLAATGCSEKTCMGLFLLYNEIRSLDIKLKSLDSIDYACSAASGDSLATNCNGFYVFESMAVARKVLSGFIV